jgi:hypothetical protein
MKKIVVLVVFIIFNINTLFSQDIILNYDLTIAYLPLEALAQYEQAHILAEKSHLSFFVDFKAEFLLFNLVFIGGNMRSNFFKDVNNYTFYPDQMNFKFFTGVRIKEFIEIGFNHYCIHPLIPYMSQQYDFYNKQILWEGAYQELYIKISGSTKSK